MADNELQVGGIGINQAVVSTIVTKAVEGVAGVASVGGNDIASNLISVITQRKVDPEAAVQARVEDDKLVVAVRLAVFYGYSLTKLADEVRTAVALAAKSQIGVEVASVDVSIDSLVFPKE